MTGFLVVFSLAQLSVDLGSEVPLWLNALALVVVVLASPLVYTRLHVQAVAI